MGLFSDESLTASWLLQFSLVFQWGRAIELLGALVHAVVFLSLFAALLRVLKRHSGYSRVMPLATRSLVSAVLLHLGELPALLHCYPLRLLVSVLGTLETASLLFVYLLLIHQLPQLLEDARQRQAAELREQKLYQRLLRLQRQFDSFYASQLQMSNDLARSNEELEQFNYSVSHDLHQPLRSILSFGEYLRQDLEEAGLLDGDRQDYLRRVLRAASRMKTLLEDLLIYSRVGRLGSFGQQINLNNIMAAAQENLQARIDETGAMIRCEPLPFVHGDDSQMLQLFQNLLSNALKYMPLDQPRQPIIEVKSIQSGGQHTISFTDNGIGIQPEFLTQIFQVFHRLHTPDEYEGNGMGLAICKKIVARHGGDLWAKSEPGKGSTFLFTIPVRGSNDECSRRSNP